jgi:hypothetical protein
VALSPIPLGQDLASSTARLIEGVDPEQVRRDDGLQHEMHEQFARLAWSSHSILIVRTGQPLLASVSAVARPCAATRSPMVFPAKPGSPASSAASRGLKCDRG